jgi:hypothetical protein
VIQCRIRNIELNYYPSFCFFYRVTLFVVTVTTVCDKSCVHSILETFEVHSSESELKTNHVISSALILGDHFAMC